MKQVVVAVTGASGAPYALRLLERLGWESDVYIHTLCSSWGERIVQEETGNSFSHWIEQLPTQRSCHYDVDDLFAPIASGSFLVDAMVVVPCSMGTMGAIASSCCFNLIERAAQVALKERRRLILVVRETPLSTINLEQMLKLSQAGAVILPPVPAFYHKPQTVLDIIDTTVDRILDTIGIMQAHTKRWGQ